MDRLVKTEVAQACAQWLERAIGSADPSVWLIRRLDLDLSLAVNQTSAEGTGKRWGEQLAESIYRTIDRGEENDSVLHFPNRAAYLARFVRDLAAGRAWGKWYYQEFESLRRLSISRAICEAFVGQPDQTGPALESLMAIHGLRDVLCALTPHDAKRVFQAWRSGTSSVDGSSESVWVGKLLQLWVETPFRDVGSSLSEDNPFRDGLWWAALAVARHPGSEADGGLMAAVDALLELRSVLSSLSPARRARVIECLASGDIEAAGLLASQEGVNGHLKALEFFSRNMHGDLNWVSQVEGVLLGEREYLQRSASPRLIARGPAVPSPFAGVFRLGPSFLASGCEEILAVCDPDVSGLLRHLLAMKCMGGERASMAENDTAMRLFSGFGEGSVAGALEALDPGLIDLHRLQTVLADVLRSLGRCQGACWLAETVSLPHSEQQAILLRDVIQDEWIFGAPLSGIAEVIAQASDLAETESVFLWRGGDSGHMPPPTDHRWLSLDRDAGVEEELAGEFHVPLSRFTRALRPPAEDLAYFSLLNVFPQIQPEFDLTWTLVSRAILKHFARRLIGFDMSSPAYVYQHFLAGTGFVRDSGERIEVELPSSDLSIILRLSGLLNETYVLPWIEGREICLRPPEE